MAHVIGRNQMPSGSRNIKTSVNLKARSTDSFSTKSSSKSGIIRTKGGIKK